MSPCPVTSVRWPERDLFVHLTVGISCQRFDTLGSICTFNSGNIMPKIWHIEMCILTSSNLLRLCCPSCVTLIQTASRACWNWVMWFAGNPKNTSSWWSSGCPWWLSCAATGFSCCSSHALPRRSHKMMMALSSRPAGFLAMSCPVSSRSLFFPLENCHITVKCPRKYSSPFASKLLPPFFNDLQLQSPCVAAIFPFGGQNEVRMDRMKQEWTKPRYMEQKWRELDKTKHQGTKLSTNRQNEDK